MAKAQWQMTQLLRQAECHIQQGERLKALACWNQVHQRHPEWLPPQARLNLLILLLEQQQEDSALQVLDGWDDHDFLASQAFNALGVHYQKSGRLQRALMAWDQAVERCAVNADAWSNRAYAQMHLLQFLAAQNSMTQALKLQPQRPDYLYNAGRIYQELRHFEAALVQYAKALEYQPDFYLCYNNTANIYFEQGEWAQAEYWVQQARQLRPDGDYLAGASVLNCLSLARWSDYLHRYREVQLAIAQGRKASVPMALLVLPMDAQEQNQGAALWVDDLYPDQRRPMERMRQPGRLRVAYVSSDFGNHAVTILTRGLLVRHDRYKLEVFLYSTRNMPDDALQQQLRSQVEHFVDISELDDAAVLQLARQHNLDIAVDLNGHTSGGRTQLFAHGIAPVQVQYLGFPAGMGAAYYDYILADSIIIPLDQRCYYREQVVYLPDCFQVNDDERNMPLAVSRADVHWPEEAFIFCCFNATYKLNPLMFGYWMTILRACPASVLILVGDNAEIRDNLLRTVTDAGIDPARLLFVTRMSYALHLGRLAAADLVLDTLPFNGGTSTSDALWAGVPVLTCTGTTFAGRMSTSLLHRAGLTDLICASLDAYVALAEQLYLNRGYLQKLRTHLNSATVRNRLFATQPTICAIEQAYFQMQERRELGLAPQAFSVNSTLL